VGVPNYLTGESADIQNDTLGEVLWLYCEAYEKGFTFTPNWDRVIKNILTTLFRERYWEQEDAGFWEMEPALRASSVGICVSGLRRLLSMDATKQWSSSWDANRVRSLLEKGYETLYTLLPNETSNLFPLNSSPLPARLRVTVHRQLIFPTCHFPSTICLL